VAGVVQLDRALYCGLAAPVVPAIALAIEDADRRAARVAVGFVLVGLALLGVERPDRRDRGGRVVAGSDRVRAQRPGELGEVAAVFTGLCQGQLVAIVEQLAERISEVLDMVSGMAD
jgi:hypothetical protein